VAYLPLIDANLRRAFRLLKDLAVDAVFTPNSVDFDFALGVASPNNVQQIYAKVVPYDGYKKSSSTNTISRSLLAQVSDIPDLKAFDKVTFENYEWTINPNFKNTGHILLFDVSRET
jgi:hypothetical protein